MLPLTETAPKPMIPVAGRPFLEHLIELLRSSGISRFLLLVSYLGAVIEQHFGSGSAFGVSIEYSYEPEPLGTGGALKLAAPMLEDEFLLVNGDTLLEIDYRRFVGDFRAGGASALIAAHVRRPHAPGNLVLADDDTVLRYDKQQPSGDYTDAGVLAARKPVLDYLPEAARSSFELEVFPRLIAAREMRAFRTETTFFDMGTPAGLAALEELLISQGRAR
jgi:NDP-sugar pyrophosphorylase family protein